MKGVIALLVLGLVAVHGRSTSLQVSPSNDVATLGENPWVVHLRIAVGTSGFLNTCGGTIIDSAWVLTAASCLVNTRFIWIRYGLVDVVRPELVIEAPSGISHPNFNVNTNSNNIGVIRTNRLVEFTRYIRPIRLESQGSLVPSRGNFCGFGAEGSNPGEQLTCFNAVLTAIGDNLLLATSNSPSSAASEFDLGAAIVNNDVQVGLLSSPGGAGIFLRISSYIPWLRSTTGLVLG